MDAAETVCRYRVTIRLPDGSIVVRFGDNNFENPYWDRKIIFGLRNFGCILNGIQIDRGALENEYSGLFGKFLPKKVGGGFSPNGRFSVKKI